MLLIMRIPYLRAASVLTPFYRKKRDEKNAKNITHPFFHQSFLLF
jgi:hypothetical protein